MVTTDRAACRVPLIAPEDAADAAVRAVYAEIERELGFGIVPNVFRALAGQPAVLRAVWDLFRATMLEGDLPRVVKEMVAVVVSAANDSRYALAVHLHSLDVQGVAAGALAALAGGDAVVPGVAPGTGALLRLARVAVRDGARAVTDADLAAAAAAGVGPEELAEAFAVIDLFRYLNGFTDLARVPIDAL
jgi:uncharacterized peroxidase-related enzyme